MGFENFFLLGEIVLDTKGIDQFIFSEEKKHKVPLSTDMNLYLEYSTPKGNYLGWNFNSNLEIMAFKEIFAIM